MRKHISKIACIVEDGGHYHHWHDDHRW